MQTRHRTELHDLAAAEPARCADLIAKWEAWAERTHVKPYPPANNATKKGKKKKQPATTE